MDKVVNHRSVKPRRIILYSGKGGVGKTTVAAATGLRCARAGQKTLILSLDVAHSLSDSFDLEVSLHDHHQGQPVPVAENLWIQEIDVQVEVERYWGDVHRYLALLFSTTGLNQIVAEELAILPGMEDIVALLYLNEHLTKSTYDLLILDCAPTGESLRFISLPSTLEWYMNKIFSLERNITRIVRPLAQKITSVPLPDDSYFSALESIFRRLEGVNDVLIDREITSVRLVTNAEKMVIKETQRAYMYFSLYGMAVDSVIVNRLFPELESDGYWKNWVLTQSRYVEKIAEYFAPVPVLRLPMLAEEVIGVERLSRLAKLLYNDTDPTRIFFDQRPYEFSKVAGAYILKVKLPFVDRKQVDLYKARDELIIRIGSFKRHIPLPRSLSRQTPQKATFEKDQLIIPFHKAYDLDEQ